MDLNFFKGEPIKIIRKSYLNEYDDYGLPKFSTNEIFLEALLYFRKSDGTVTPYEVGFDTILTAIFPYQTVINQTDNFVIRGELWQVDGTVMPLTYQAAYSNFMKPPVIISLRQHKGNVKT